MSCISCTVLYSATKTGNGNNVTCDDEEATLDIVSVSLSDTDSPRANDDDDDDDAILSRDQADVPRDTPPREGVGARQKTTKVLQRKNTPAVLPKVTSLYGTLHMPSLP